MLKLLCVMLRTTTIRAIIFFLFIGWAFSSYAQKVAITNNLLFDAAGALSAGVEVPFSKKLSFEVYGSLRPWKRGDESVHKHWAVQSQVRFWPCQVMNGFFVGPYFHFAEFNYANQDLLFGLLRGLNPHRYEGWLVGGGLGCGYEYPLAKHWNLGAEVGIGYTYINVKKFDCEVCGKQRDYEKYHYIGVSRIGLSLIYIF